MQNTFENDDYISSYYLNNEKLEHSFNIRASEQIKKLTEGIEKIKKELHEQVILNHKDFLNQVSSASNLEADFSQLKTHVESLYSGAEKIRSQLTQFYTNIEKNSELYLRLHQVCHILRYIVLLQIRLKDLEKSTELVTQAKIIQDLIDISQDPSLAGIDFVSVSLKSVYAQKQRIVKDTKHSFSQAILSGDKSKISNAVQILINLQNLDSTVKELINDKINKCRENIHSILFLSTKTNAIPKGKQTPGGASYAVHNVSKEKLWTSMEHFFLYDFYQHCKQVQFLQNILSEQNENDGFKNLSSNFWVSVTENTSKEMKSASSNINTIFKEDYPNLLKLYCDTVQKLKSKDFIFKRSVIAPWENAYLSITLSKLLDPVGEMFEGELIPNHDQIDSLIRIITNYISVALVEENLSNTIAKNVVKCIHSFAIKTENLVATGPETSQTIGLSNSGQQLNVQLSNVIYYFKTQIDRMLTNMSSTLPTSTVTIIKDGLKNLDRVVASILAPLVVSINSAIETIIVTIHLEPDWNRLQIPVTKTIINCSPYMRELIEFIARSYSVHLSPFNHAEELASSCSRISIRCIDLFVRHSTLIRPITQGGRLRLQTDYHHLETALCSICPHLPSLGRPYRLLKSMATLFTLQPTEIVKSQSVGSSVPQSTVLFLLFTFAGSDFHSPHYTAGWSIEKLSAWLDEHTEENDRLELISGAVQSYLTIVRKKNITNFDPMYVIIADFLKQIKENYVLKIDSEINK